MPKTASRCVVEASRGAHVFEVADYSLHKGIGVGRSIRSATFDVGGYEWSVLFYPDGKAENAEDCVAVGLELMTADAGVVRASYQFGLISQTTGEPWFVAESRTVEFHTHTIWSRRDLMKRNQLEASQYLRDDRLAIQCAVTVVKETRVLEARAVPEIDVPPSDLVADMGRLLDQGDGADITFEVQGESFPAHRTVLASRSQVFRAELHGQMKERSVDRIVISDMQPAVFRALLRFIYTDALPPMDDLSKDDSLEITRHLLVAADRYAMERLKLICAQILYKSLDVESVTTTLALADRHNCSGLKDACIEFIISSNKMDDVTKTQGFANLKRSCPCVLVEVLEKAGKLRKI
jgi:speckle-type POZ protein